MRATGTVNVNLNVLPKLPGILEAVVFGNAVGYEPGHFLRLPRSVVCPYGKKSLISISRVIVIIKIIGTKVSYYLMCIAYAC